MHRGDDHAETRTSSAGVCGQCAKSKQHCCVQGRGTWQACLQRPHDMARMGGETMRTVHPLHDKHGTLGLPGLSRASLEDLALPGSPESLTASGPPSRRRSGGLHGRRPPLTVVPPSLVRAMRQHNVSWLRLPRVYLALPPPPRWGCSRESHHTIRSSFGPFYKKQLAAIFNLREWVLRLIFPSRSRLNLLYVVIPMPHTPTPLGP